MDCMYDTNLFFHNICFVDVVDGYLLRQIENLDTNT